MFSVFYEKDEAWIGGGLECVNVPILKMKINKNEKTFINQYYPFASIKSIMFLNSDNGWAVGSPSTILHFDGQQWGKAEMNDDYSSLNSVFFSDENNGISAGYGGSVLIYSENMWTKERLTTNQNLNGAVIFKNKYFAVGDSGTIIYRDLTLNNIITGINNNNDEIVQVYPNPCDEFLNIVIPCENNDLTASISVSSLSGEIIMQKELKLSTRSLTYPLVTREFKNGLYVIKTTFGGKTTTKEFIIRH
jgi:hypothetical protein